MTKTWAVAWVGIVCAGLVCACKPKTSDAAPPKPGVVAKQGTKPAKKAVRPHIEARGIPGMLALGDAFEKAPKEGKDFRQVGEASSDPNGNKTVAYALKDTKASQSLFGSYDADGKLAVITVEDSAVKAPRGVHTGMPIQEVIAHYGVPSKTERIDFAEQGLQRGYGYCATFAEVPTMRFCFTGRGWQERLKSWGKDVVEPNLEVDTIYVVK